MPPYTCSERGRGAYLFGQLHRRGVRQNFTKKKERYRLQNFLAKWREKGKKFDQL